MGLKTIFTESTIAKYVRKIRESPSQLIANYHLLSTVTYYALCGFPLGSFSFGLHIHRLHSMLTLKYSMGSGFLWSSALSTGI